MFDDNNNSQCRENKTLSYKEVFVRKVDDVENNDKER